MVLYLILIFSAYFIFLLLCLVGWRKVVRTSSQVKEEVNELVTLIVPFRNEAANLPALLSSLIKQDLNSEKWEVVFVNDHSTDESAELISKWISLHIAIRATLLHAEGTGKKNAITEGIHQASGEIILTTDADCELPVNWISSMRNSFVRGTHMVVGVVRMKQSTSLFSKMQVIEFSSLIGSGLAMLKLGFPIFCNGASLGYRKLTFEEVGGYSDNIHIASGDDEFLMRKILKRYPNGISIVNNLTAAPTTLTQPNLAAFISQRVRWAGKWKANDSWTAKLLALFIFCFQLSTVIAFFLMFISSHIETIVTLLFIKMLVEGVFLFTVNRQLQQTFSAMAFIMLQIIYPFYVIAIGVISQIKKTTWKERVIS